MPAAFGGEQKKAVKIVAPPGAASAEGGDEGGDAVRAGRAPRVSLPSTAGLAQRRGPLLTTARWLPEPPQVASPPRVPFPRAAGGLLRLGAGWRGGGFAVQAPAAPQLPVPRLLIPGALHPEHALFFAEPWARLRPGAGARRSDIGIEGAAAAPGARRGHTHARGAGNPGGRHRMGPLRSRRAPQPALWRCTPKPVPAA